MHKEVEYQMKKRGCYQRFIDNTLDYHREKAGAVIDSTEDNLYELCQVAFQWDNTPEGRDYWRTVSAPISEINYDILSAHNAVLKFISNVFKSKTSRTAYYLKTNFNNCIEDLIYGAFDPKKSPEGEDFWLNIIEEDEE